MNISLTPQLEAFVKDCVDGGRYKSASAVVREGLGLLREAIREQAKRDARQRDLERELHLKVFRSGLDEDTDQ